MESSTVPADATASMHVGTASGNNQNKLSTFKTASMSALNNTCQY